MSLILPAHKIIERAFLSGLSAICPSYPTITRGIGKQHGFQHVGIEQRPIGFFGGMYFLIRRLDYTSRRLTFPFIINGNTEFSKRTQQEKRQCQSKQRQAKGPFHGNSQKQPNAWLRVLFQPHKWLEERFHGTNPNLLSHLLSLVTHQPLLSNLRKVRTTPIGHVVTLPSENIMPLYPTTRFARDLIERLGLQRIPSRASSRVVPNLRGKPEVVTAFDLIRLRVIFQFFQISPVGFPFFICAVGRAVFRVIGHESIVVHAREPKAFCILKIKKLFRADCPRLSSAY